MEPSRRELTIPLAGTLHTFVPERKHGPPGMRATKDLDFNTENILRKLLHIIIKSAIICHRGTIKKQTQEQGVHSTPPLAIRSEPSISQREKPAHLQNYYTSLSIFCIGEVLIFADAAE